MPGRIQSIERAAAVLRLLSGDARGSSLAEISRTLELPKGTALGIVRTLQHVGFVQQDPDTGHYQLGGGVLRLGTGFLHGNELRRRALNWADVLASRTGESVHIATLHESRALVVHHVVRPEDSRRLDVGTLLPLHASALGKVLLAFDPRAGEEGAVEAEAAFTERTLTSPQRLRSELDQVRAQGWAVDVEELVHGEVSLAAPIRDHRGGTAGAVGIRGAVERLIIGEEPRPDVLSFVRDAARSISRELGAVPW
jgi:DNA-binding IclR family transcriptional regulator